MSLTSSIQWLKNHNLNCVHFWASFSLQWCLYMSALYTSVSASRFHSDQSQSHQPGTSWDYFVLNRPYAKNNTCRPIWWAKTLVTPEFMELIHLLCLYRVRFGKILTQNPLFVGARKHQRLTQTHRACRTADVLAKLELWLWVNRNLQPYLSNIYWSSQFYLGCISICFLFGKMTDHVFLILLGCFWLVSLVYTRTNLNNPKSLSEES